MKTSITKKIICSCCVFFFVFSTVFGVFLGSPQKAEAQFVPVGDIVNLEFHAWDFLKENALDAVLFAAVKLAAQQVVVNLTDWIASGFEGSPAFVTNEQLLVRDLQDQLVLELLTEETAQLYAESPFRDSLIGLVAEEYTERYSSSGYTLDETVDDVDAFTGGDFLAGGWEGWYEMTQNPNNNFFGAYAKTQNEVQSRITAAQTIVKTELDRGEGFFSLRDANGNILTPGSIIEGQFNFNLGSGLRQLEAADEYSEVISASITALTQAVIQQGVTEVSDAANDAIEDAEDSVRRTLSDQEDILEFIEELEERAQEQEAEAEATDSEATDS